MEKFDKRGKLLKEWLDKFEETKEFAREVSQVLEMNDYQKKIVARIPANNGNLQNELEEIFTADIEYLEQTLPTIDLDSSYSDSSINAIAVSGSTGGYAYIQNYLDSSAAIDHWKKDSLSSLAEVQERQDRFKHIIIIVRKLDNDIANEFIQAEDTFPLFKQDLAAIEELGVLFRNPMEHLKGRLWERTKKICRNETGKVLQGKPKWDPIAQFTAKNGMNSNEYIELIDRGNDFDELYGFFSSMLKKSAKYTKQHTIEQVHKYVDTIFSILSLSDIKKIENAL